MARRLQRKGIGRDRRQRQKGKDEMSMETMIRVTRGFGQGMGGEGT